MRDCLCMFVGSIPFLFLVCFGMYPFLGGRVSQDVAQSNGVETQTGGFAEISRDQISVTGLFLGDFWFGSLGGNPAKKRK